MRVVWYVFVAGVLCILFSFGPTTFAQTTTDGAILGVVRDESGAVIAGANVTIVNVETGISRSAVTDDGGRYRVPSLIPDHYELQVEKEGFEIGIRKGIQLTVGSELEINIALHIGAVTQKTEVTADAPMVETTNATISGLVNDTEIRDLPLNGRSFDQLVALDSDAPTIRNRSVSALSGVGAAYSVNGARDQSNRYLIDGAELLQAGFQTNLPGGALGINMGVEAIQEFSVLTGNYGAAFGKKMGAMINVATRSGTNAFHGSAFEFLRNSDLDALNVFDTTQPPFRRNEFGGSFGGPIRKNGTFIFADYEGLRENQGQTVVEVVPDNNARNGMIPNSSGTLVNVGVATGVQPFLAAFPLANGPELGGGTAEALFNPNQVSSQNFYLVRIDHQISDKDSLFARYEFSNTNTYGNSQIIYWAPTSPSNIQNLALEETRTGSTTVNTIRVGVDRSTLHNANVATIALPSSAIFLSGAPAMGEISFTTTSTTSGGTTAGALTAQGTINANQTFEITQYFLGDSVFHQHGAHSFQFGGQVQRIQQNQNKPNDPYGLFSFTSLQNFLTGSPSLFTAPAPTAGTAEKDYLQYYTDAFIEDDYKIRRNLTLNLGLRWEFLTPPTDALNRIANYHFTVVNGLPVVNSSPTLGSPFYNSHYDNFAPRLGFAWDIMGDGKTAVRGGFGMFYDQLEMEFKEKTTDNLPFFGTLQVANPPFPLGYSGAAGASALPAPDLIDPNLKVPTRVQYNLNVERQITSNIALTVGYIGSEAYHLVRSSDLNTVVPQTLTGGVLFYPSPGTRAQPALGATTYLSSDATANYQGLNLIFDQRLSHGLRYKVAFTYSKDIDTASSVVGGYATGNPDFTMNPQCLSCDRGLSSFDQKRNLVVNFTYDFPWEHSTSAVARWIGGWQAGGILTVADGMPFTALTGFNRSQNKENVTADRPDLVPGCNTNPILGGTLKYYNTSCFVLPPAGEYGDVGRNTLIGPGFETLDANLTKIFPVGERVKVNFRAEFFNFLNHPNFGLPGNSVFSSSGTVLSSAGLITTTTSASREIQFGLKLIF